MYYTPAPLRGGFDVMVDPDNDPGDNDATPVKGKGIAFIVVLVIGAGFIGLMLAKQNGMLPF